MVFGSPSPRCRCASDRPPSAGLLGSLLAAPRARPGRRWRLRVPGFSVACTAGAGLARRLVRPAVTVLHAGDQERPPPALAGQLRGRSRALPDRDPPPADRPRAPTATAGQPASTPPPACGPPSPSTSPHRNLLIASAFPRPRAVCWRGWSSTAWPSVVHGARREGRVRGQQRLANLHTALGLRPRCCRACAASSRRPRNMCPGHTTPQPQRQVEPPPHALAEAARPGWRSLWLDPPGARPAAV